MCAFTFGAVLGDPVAERARVMPKVTGHLGDRLSGLPDDPYRPLPELRIELPACLCLLLIVHASTVWGDIQTDVFEQEFTVGLTVFGQVFANRSHRT